MQTIQLEGIELRPNKYFDITAEAEAVTNQGESSSEAGESEVTEAWEERDLDGFEIVSLVYWPNEDTPIFFAVFHFYCVVIGVEVYQVLTYFLYSVYLKTVSPW